MSSELTYKEMSRIWREELLIAEIKHDLVTKFDQYGLSREEVREVSTLLLRGPDLIDDVDAFLVEYVNRKKFKDEFQRHLSE